MPESALYKIIALALIKQEMARAWAWEQKKLAARNYLKIRFLNFFAPLIVNFIRSSWFVEKRMHPEAQALLESGEPVLLAVWHGRMYGVLKAIPPEKLAVLVSESTDGEMLTQLMKGLGFKHFVRGSFGRNGTIASRQILRFLQKGGLSITFAVDGPKGPGFVVKPGIIRLASQAQVKVIPFVPSCNVNMVDLSHTWDRYQTPSPFSRNRLYFGEPITVPATLSDEEMVQLQSVLQTRLDQLLETADASWGKGGPKPIVSKRLLKVFS